MLDPVWDSFNVEMGFIGCMKMKYMIYLTARPGNARTVSAEYVVRGVIARGSAVIAVPLPLPPPLQGRKS